MKKLTLLGCLLMIAGGSVAVQGRDDATPPGTGEGAVPWSAGLPVFDHVVIVVEENKDYEQIIDEPGSNTSKAPYINLTLRKQGANLTRMFGEEHNSQGNYFWLFSGSNQGVGFRDGVPDVAIQAPNLGTARGDTWLKDHLHAYYQWAKTHNSLLIVTWDENDDQAGPAHHAKVLGLTNPFVEPTDQRARNMQNRIPTIIAGAHVKQGDYLEDKGVTHVNLLRTLEAMYGLPRSGAQQAFASAGGIRDDYVITDIFERVK